MWKLHKSSYMSWLREDREVKRGVDAYNLSTSIGRSFGPRFKLRRRLNERLPQRENDQAP